MGDLVNLRSARKARDRQARESQAAANRAFYGRTKAARVAEEAARTRVETVLDGAKRED